MNLFHVSERGDIERFEPRLPADPGVGIDLPVVWAVAETHLVNYLLPRDCPRVCIRSGPVTNEADRRRFLPDGEVQIRIVIESDWAERVRASTLWLYHFPEASFRVIDANAGYHVSDREVRPLNVSRVTALTEQMAARGAVLHEVPDLRKFAAEVVGSSLLFSIIRLRNARPASGVQ